MELCGNTIKSASELSKAVDKHDKNQQQTKAIKPAVKVAAKETTPGNVGTEIDGAQSLLFNLDSANCDVVHTLTTFNTAADFMKEKSKVDFSGHTYVIKNCPDLQAAFDERNYKQAMEQERGQAPGLGANKSSIRERMLDLTPNTNIQFPRDDDSNMHRRWSKHISMFLCLPALVYKGFDKRDMAHCRYQIAGEREIIVMECDHLLDFAIKIGVHIEQDQDFTTYMECVVDALSTTEAVEVLKGVGARATWCHDLNIPVDS